MVDAITLRVAGKIYGGWTKVNVTRSLSSVAGDFSLELTWQWSEAEPWPIKEGDACTVDIGNDRVITGYIDDWMPSYDDKEVTISVAGRAKTGDLVDSSVVHESGLFTNQTLTDIAKTVCKPYGISVVTETDAGDVFPRIAIEQGETCYELLDRLARQRGVLLTCNAMGNLVITRASKTKMGVALILGENILAARGRFSQRDRASEYIVKGTGYGGGREWDEAATATIGGQKAVIPDADVRRYRPKIIINEDVFTVDGASKRGQWQRQRALGQSKTSEITVAGWRIEGEGGALWDINKRVYVKDEIQNLDGELLIETVMFSEDDAGRLAVIALVPPEAMDIPAIVEKQTTVKGSWNVPNYLKRDPE